MNAPLPDFLFYAVILACVAIVLLATAAILRGRSAFYVLSLLFATAAAAIAALGLFGVV